MSPRGLGLSALLHVFIVLLIAFGLPMLPQEDILYQPQVISVELDIAPVANAPNRTPKPHKKPEPEKPKPAPKAEKEPVKKPEPPKPKKPEPKKEEPKKPEPKKPEPKKDEPKKEEPKKEEPKEDEPSFDDFIKSLDTAPAPEEPKPAEATQGDPIKSDVPYDPSRPMSQTVKDSIRNQIMKCWNYQGGAKNQENLVAFILVVFREDGSVIDARLRPEDVKRRDTDYAFRALVDSAIRATKNPDCVPLKGLPVDSYTSWSKVELVFDPDEMW